MAEGVDLKDLGEADTGQGAATKQQNVKPSYAERLKTNIRYDQRLKRNVLDIEIEKLDRENDIDLGQACVARLLTSI